MSRIDAARGRRHAPRRQGVDQCRVPGLDRRALPARLLRERARRRALPRRSLPRGRRAPAVADHLPEVVHRDAGPAQSAGPWPHLADRSRRHAARHEPHDDSHRRGSGGAALASQWMAARHGAAPARRARRCRPSRRRSPACRRDADEPRTRLHALWTLDGLDAITVAHVEAALQDRSPHVRAASLRIAERWLDAPTPGLRAVIEGATRRPRPTRAPAGRGVARRAERRPGEMGGDGHAARAPRR